MKDPWPILANYTGIMEAVGLLFRIEIEARRKKDFSVVAIRTEAGWIAASPWQTASGTNLVSAAAKSLFSWGYCWEAWEPVDRKSILEIENHLLQYTIHFVWENEVWFVEIIDLPHCMSQGSSLGEAFAMFLEASELWIADEKKENGE